jgi:uncharacterized protein
MLDIFGIKQIHYNFVVLMSIGNENSDLMKEWKQKAESLRNENHKFLKNLKKKDRKKIEKQVFRYHDVIFEKLDCLECANCCKTISPIINQMDIKRLSRHLKMKSTDFFKEFCVIDNEGDTVFRATPCPFLEKDNFCNVYESRPKACREFPHTNQPGFLNRIKINWKNTLSCPAVFHIVQMLKNPKGKS